MHLVLLGVMKTLISLWSVGPLKVLLQSAYLHKISKKLLILRYSVPLEFSRRPRIISHYLHFKAKEFRTFLLYTGPMVLKNILPVELYNHFLLLHCAITILVSEDHIAVESNIDYADELLNEFVKQFADLYGKEYVSQNIHNLLHLCSDVKRFGTLDRTSAFRFENYMSTIKKMIRKGELPLQQVARRYSEMEAAEDELYEKKVERTLRNLTLKQLHCSGPLPSDANPDIRQFKVLKTSTFTINCNNSKDSCVALKEGGFVIVKNILEGNDGKPFIVGEKLVPKENLYEYPESTLFNISITTWSNPRNCSAWFLDEIKGKAWKVPCKKGIIVIPLLHSS